MKIDHTILAAKCSAMTLDSGNIRLIEYSWGFRGDEASNDSKVFENVDFQDFRTLRLQNLRK